MKHLRLLLLLLAFAASTVTASAADKTPTLPIDQALKIAQDYLTQKGAATDHQIISITLEAAGVSKLFWYAHWQPAIAGDENQKKVTGMHIDMDGSTSLVVTGPTGGYDPPVGKRPYGARNIH
jgi:hypothetical protein